MCAMRYYIRLKRLKALFLPVDIQHTQCPYRFFDPTGVGLISFTLDAHNPIPYPHIYTSTSTRYVFQL